MCTTIIGSIPCDTSPASPIPISSGSLALHLPLPLLLNRPSLYPSPKRPLTLILIELTPASCCYCLATTPAGASVPYAVFMILLGPAMGLASYSIFPREKLHMRVSRSSAWADNADLQARADGSVEDSYECRSGGLCRPKSAYRAQMLGCQRGPGPRTVCGRVLSENVGEMLVRCPPERAGTCADVSYVRV
ncbi:hypothetical protein BV20DRAFT_73498 [Pilatotrama ljubarskyi]|nr:hypothetical protein BV20DRAFT_73498 [Pilatotrama ljubarskyi]